MIWDVDPIDADMAELVDALSSDGSGYAMRVRIPLSAPKNKFSFIIKNILQYTFRRE